MSADSNRKSVKTTGLVVRPQAASDKTYMESVVGFFNEVVPQAYVGSPKSEDKETIQWVKFEYSDINDPLSYSDETQHNGNTPPLLLILAYSNGVQVWSIVANGDAQEVLSWRQGPVKMLRILPTPEPGSQDTFTAKRPLIALCDSSSAGEPFCAVNFISLKSGDQVHCIKFKQPVREILCNKRVVVISFSEKILVFSVSTLREMFTISGCYPAGDTGTVPAALGTRWLAYADKKLAPTYQTCGGMAGDGVQSYAATVIHAAKTLTKGLTIFGETVANSLAGHKPHPVMNNKEQKLKEQFCPGIVTILDVMAVSSKEVNLDDDGDVEGIVAHFPAHANEPVANLAFDQSGLLLFTACKLGHNFHIFRIFPHPANSLLGSVHHVYTLHRGDTTAKVQDVAFSNDSRWVSVSTLRGTTHIFPITPYGGAVCVRTHTSPRVVNRMSRFQKTAGLEDIPQPSPSGRNSPVLSGSPNSSTVRLYDSHPSVSYHNNSSGKFTNPRLPPYPHPTTVYPLAQLRQPLIFPVPGISPVTAPKSPPGKTRKGSGSSHADNISIATVFAPLRAWLVSSPSLARDKREKHSTDGLYIINCHGTLIEYTLEPRTPANVPKPAEDSPIELEVVPHAQWCLQRSTNSSEIRPPLPGCNPLIIATDYMINYQKKHSRPSDNNLRENSFNETFKIPKGNNEESDGNWLSQVEIITHVGPHRRLWMGPQFTFMPLSDSAQINSSCHVDNSELQKSIQSSISTNEVDLQNLSINSRSNPVAMPQSHRTNPVGIRTPVLIEARSGSFEHSPGALEVCNHWSDTSNPSSLTNIKDAEFYEDQLKESIADAMIESPVKENAAEDCSEHINNLITM